LPGLSIFAIVDDRGFVEGPPLDRFAHPRHQNALAARVSHNSSRS
jgi:hypothetical protein